jgi:biopolymer transport protein ExbD
MARRDTDTEVASDMTPMIDCVFLLLIFFMCATKFRMPEGALTSWLPRDRGTSSATKPPANPGCRITFEREGNQIICWADDVTIPFASEYGEDTLSIAQRDFDYEFELQAPDMRAIEQHIQNRKDTYRGVNAKGLPVIIDFAGTVPTRFVVDIVNICKRLDIADVAFAAPEEAMD